MTNKPEAPKPAQDAPSQTKAHPDDVAAEIIALAASRGYAISTDGFTLVKNLGNMLSHHAYKGSV